MLIAQMIPPIQGGSEKPGAPKNEISFGLFCLGQHQTAGCPIWANKRKNRPNMVLV